MTAAGLRLVLLSALGMLLAGAVGLELASGPPAESGAAPGAPGPAAQQAPVPAPDPGPSQSEVQGILARPLFSPNRRPPAAGVAAPDAPPPSLPRVAGILMDGSQRSVIFATADGVRPVVLNVGGEVNGFRVQSIEDGQVTLLGPDGPRVLHPTFDQAAPAPANRPAPSPAFQGLTGIPGLPGLPSLPPGPGLAR